jgi:branched-chain amino acid transport system ATP-binding protein
MTETTLPGDPHGGRSGLGYVPEERRIFGDLTVEENLRSAAQPHRDGAPFWTVEHLFELFPNLERAPTTRWQAAVGW